MNTQLRLETLVTHTHTHTQPATVTTTGTSKASQPGRGLLEGSVSDRKTDAGAMRGAESVTQGQ